MVHHRELDLDWKCNLAVDTRRARALAWGEGVQGIQDATEMVGAFVAVANME